MSIVEDKLRKCLLTLFSKYKQVFINRHRQTELFKTELFKIEFFEQILVSNGLIKAGRALAREAVAASTVEPVCHIT
jgi:hypothetical protein